MQSGNRQKAEKNREKWRLAANFSPIFPGFTTSRPQEAANFPRKTGLRRPATMGAALRRRFSNSCYNMLATSLSACKYPTTGSFAAADSARRARFRDAPTVPCQSAFNALRLFGVNLYDFSYRALRSKRNLSDSDGEQARRAES
jgi:hypothetical protein